jgi:prepilin-type N-terminal cleavage/methylation domain-containing protein
MTTASPVRLPGPRAPDLGFSLVEVLVALLVGSLVVSLAVRLGTQALEAERGQGARAGLTAALRTGLNYLAYELEGAGADSVSGPDLDSVAAGIAFRAQRGLKVTCRLAPDTVVVRADTAVDWSARGPVPGRDSILLYAPGDSAVAVDAWDPLPLLSIRAAICPGGAPGLAYGTLLDSSLIARRRHSGRTAIRLFESVAVRAYSGAGGWQLGQQSLSGGGVVQPLAGPLAPAGLSVAAVARSGAPVAVGAGAWAIRLVLRGQSDRQLSAGMAARSPGTADSVATVVHLRNLP